MVAKCDMNEYVLDAPLVVLYSSSIVMIIEWLSNYKVHTFVLDFAFCVFYCLQRPLGSLGDLRVM